MQQYYMESPVINSKRWERWIPLLDIDEGRSFDVQGRLPLAHRKKPFLQLPRNPRVAMMPTLSWGEPNTENRELSWCQLCRHWGHRSLSWWDPLALSVTHKLASWQYNNSETVCLFRKVHCIIHHGLTDHLYIALRLITLRNRVISQRYMSINRHPTPMSLQSVISGSDGYH